MLHRKFELIPIKIGFFNKFLKLLQKPRTLLLLANSGLAHLACFVGNHSNWLKLNVLKSIIRNYYCGPYSPWYSHLPCNFT